MKGRGAPSCGTSSLVVIWSASQVTEYVTQLFPVLSTLSFHYCYVVSSRLVRIPDHIKSATDLNTFFKEHRRARVSAVFIHPDVPILHHCSDFMSLYKDLNERVGRCVILCNLVCIVG